MDKSSAGLRPERANAVNQLQVELRQPLGDGNQVGSSNPPRREKRLPTGLVLRALFFQRLCARRPLAVKLAAFTLCKLLNATAASCKASLAKRYSGRLWRCLFNLCGSFRKHPLRHALWAATPPKTPATCWFSAAVLVLVSVCHAPGPQRTSRNGTHIPTPRLG